jgi:L-asparaginase / beta-aspartyl-peptidase
MNVNKFVLLFILAIVLFSCNESKVEKKDYEVEEVNQLPVIVIHGGAGNISQKNLSEKYVELYSHSLSKIIDSGYAMLSKGEDAIKVVERVVNLLENDSLFNAGKGAVLTNEGKAELDASIMDGKTLNAGAVASVSRIKNPISLALKIMDNSEHVFMMGSGAEFFASEQKIEFVDNSYFITSKNKERYNRENSPMGTVGCVVRDMNGNLCAGTSTGGMWGKKFGRVGDVPVIGAGTYANNQSCAVSCTGWGEYFIRQVVAYQVHARIMWNNQSLKEAVESTLNEVDSLGGNGGMIAINKNGDVIIGFNTTGMFRASIDKNKEKKVEIFD